MKLYSLENQTEQNNELLIDKVLRQSKQSKTPVSLTADVIKQRQELKKDIEEQLEGKESDDKEEDSDQSNQPAEDDDTVTSDKEDTGSSNEETDKSTDDNQEPESDQSKQPDDVDTDTTEQQPDTKQQLDDDLDSGADDKDNLKSMIGSGLNKDKPEGKKDSTEKPAPKEGTASEIVSKESFKPKLTLGNIFDEIKNSHRRYLTALEDFNVEAKVKAEEQPIVYVKDSVLESLNNLITVSNNYIDRSKVFITETTDSVKNINARLTVIKQFVDSGQYHFTNKLVNSLEILSKIGITEKTKLVDVSKYLIDYSVHSNALVNFILSNKFSDIPSALTNSNFVNESNDFVYKKMLPGFVLVKAHIPKYINYLKTDIKEFHYYKLVTFKTKDLYDLDAIALFDDNELNRVMANMDKLLIELSLTVDNFNTVNEGFNKLIEELKVLVYDVGSLKQKNLTELNLDDKVKDFIKLKLASEIYHVNASMLIDYLLNAIIVLNVVLEFKQP